MPVQYSGIVDEHLAVRRAAGIFDISHMGQLCISGENACEFLNRVLTNDVRRLGIGQGQYTLMCNARGGVVDDLYVYRVMDREYLLILNASRVETDLDWLERQRQADPGSARLHDLSATHGALAVQGPAVAEIICRCFPDDPSDPQGQLAALPKNEIISVAFKDAAFRIARTGYTGEDGFELFGPATHLEALWNQLLEAGRAQGLKPCGLGARDTLRTEMCYPLYGHELDETTTPLEAGLGKFVALEKEDFVGREPLLQQKQFGVSKKCVALVMIDASPPPRPGYAICPAECAEPIGRMVSGTQSPSLGKGIGLGYVPPNHSKPGTVLGIEIRGKRYAASVVAKPIYRRQGVPSANAV
jgi:aminomethyltransferase